MPETTAVNSYQVANGKANQNQALTNQTESYFHRVFYPDKSDKILWLKDKERKWAIIATIAYVLFATGFAIISNIENRNYIEKTLKPLYSKVPSKSFLEQLKLSPKITLPKWRNYLLTHLNLSPHTTLTQWNHFIETSKTLPFTYYLPYVAVVLMLVFATWYARRSLLIVPLALAGLTLNIVPGLPWLFFAGYLGYHRFSNKSKNPQDKNTKITKEIPTTNKNKTATHEKSPLDKVRERRMVSASKRYTPPKKTK